MHRYLDGGIGTTANGNVMIGARQTSVVQIGQGACSATVSSLALSPGMSVSCVLTAVELRATSNARVDGELTLTSSVLRTGGGSLAFGPSDSSEFVLSRPMSPSSNGGNLRIIGGATGSPSSSAGRVFIGASTLLTPEVCRPTRRFNSLLIFLLLGVLTCWMRCIILLA